MDMSAIIVPKSDQINADDLQGGRTVTVTVAKVAIRGGQEQPISIHLNETDKVYRPCKSMCRVLAQAWGLDSAKYAGKSMTLYTDPTVKFGPLAVGGIRISHMSHIDGPMVMALTATKGVKKSFKVLPLEVRREQADKVADGVTALIERIKACDPANLLSITDDPAVVKQRTWLAKNRPELAAEVDAVLDASRPVNEDDPFGLPEIDQEKRGDADMGETHTDPDPQHRKLADIMITGIRNANGDVDAIGEIMDAQRDAMKEWPAALKQEVYDEHNIALGRGDA